MTVQSFHDFFLNFVVLEFQISLVFSIEPDSKNSFSTSRSIGPDPGFMETHRNFIKAMAAGARDSKIP